MSAFKLHLGAQGIYYRSAPEAKISFPLFDIGINSHDVLYPQSFVDDEGTAFNAMSDFLCVYTGIFFEFKNGMLNGLKTKTFADNAMRAFNKQKARGWITKKNEALKTLIASWSASATKFRLVQEQLAASGQCSVMVYDQLPDEDTIGRITRSKVFWCVYGDETWRAFMSFRTLARYGFKSDYEINGHIFQSHGGIVAR